MLLRIGNVLQQVPIHTLHEALEGEVVVGVLQELGSALVLGVTNKLVPFAVLIVLENQVGVGVEWYPRLHHVNVLDPTHLDAALLCSMQEHSLRVWKCLQQVDQVLFANAVAVSVLFGIVTCGVALRC